MGKNLYRLMRVFCIIVCYNFLRRVCMSRPVEKFIYRVMLRLTLRGYARKTFYKPLVTSRAWTRVLIGKGLGRAFLSTEREYTGGRGRSQADLVQLALESSPKDDLWNN